MKTKSLILFIIGMCLLSCNNTHSKSKNNNLKSILFEILHEKDDSKKNISLILFIPNEHLCSECLNKEILNIKNNQWIEENTIIIGVSKNRREFLSNFKTINPLKIITINETDYKHIFYYQAIQYFLFDKEKKLVFSFFYPQPCDESATIEYFESVKRMVML